MQYPSWKHAFLVLLLAAILPTTSVLTQPCFSGNTVKGAILQKYKQLDQCRGFLGRPLTAETTTPDGHGRFNHFQGGSIYWTPQTGAHEVHGAIREKWKAMGWERSILGYPVTDEIAGSNGVRYSKFQGGTIFWTAQKGTWVEAASGQQAGRSIDQLRTQYNDLVVFFDGYTANQTLYVKNKKSGRIQAKRLQTVNGKPAAHFTLSKNGGDYLIMKDTCTDKADCLPSYQTIGQIKLRAGQDWAITL